jgi:hypothetical protein
MPRSNCGWHHGRWRRTRLCAAAACTLAGPLAGVMAAVAVVKVVERAGRRSASRRCPSDRPPRERRSGRGRGLRFLRGSSRVTRLREEANRQSETGRTGVIRSACRRSSFKAGIRPLTQPATCRSKPAHLRRGDLSLSTTSVAPGDSEARRRHRRAQNYSNILCRREPNLGATPRS